MAHRELQGRLQLAEQQVRMYQEAMGHLMAAPRTSNTSRRTQGASAIGASASTRESFLEHSVGEQLPGATSDLTADESGVEAINIVNKSLDSNKRREDDPLGREGDKNKHGAAAPSSGVDDGGVGVEMILKNTLGWVGDTVVRLGQEVEGWIVQPWAHQGHPGLRGEVDEIIKRRAAVWEEKEMVARARADLARCRGELLSRRIALDARRSDLAEAVANCRSRKALYSDQLLSAMKMGALNDSFHIWHQGPFATINGFRVGRLGAHLVDWQEVNAGVGQAAIVLVTVAMAMGVEFSKYLIAPCGSFSKIARSEDGRVLYSLHTDESFSLFPRRNFNLALKAFLHCLGEVGDHVQEHDPTLQLPYHIKEKEGTVGGLPVALGSSLEDWTRALKYMLTDLKWIAAWAAKYLPPC